MRLDLRRRVVEAELGVYGKGRSLVRRRSAGRKTGERKIAGEHFLSETTCTRAEVEHDRGRTVV